jgi:hypothetical protein
MPKKELREYYAWFQDIMPQRIDELASAVRLSPGFETWRPDYKPDSLNALGHWFAAQVQTRPLTTEEEEEFSALVPNPRKTWELTNRTLSLAMDLGMYLSQVLLRNHSSLQWDQPLGSKRFIDYGQPVLMGFVRKVPFNPVGMMVTFAYGLARKTRTGKGLREIYDIWSRMIDQKPS